MQSAVAVDRLHFAFTVTFHYIFPQLTMGLALLIVILKTLALRTGDDHYNRAARFCKPASCAFHAATGSSRLMRVVSKIASQSLARATSGASFAGNSDGAVSVRPAGPQSVTTRPSSAGSTSAGPG